MLPLGTVTFLFTDIQGSTQLWDSFPDEVSAALGVHDAIVTAGVAAFDGHIVKNTGDGLFAAFAAADSASRPPAISSGASSNRSGIRRSGDASSEVASP